MDDDPSRLRRLLALRRFPLFAKVELGELALLADNAIATRLLPGTPLAERAGLHLILDGTITTHDGAVWQAHEPFGLLHVLANRTPPPAFAKDHVQTLWIAARDVSELLEDSFGLLHAVLRELAVHLLERSAFTTIAVPALSSQPLSLVERLIVLRQHPAFAKAPLHALAAVAQTLDEATLSPGTRIAELGDAFDETMFVISGTLLAADREHGPGSTLGWIEGLAGVRRATSLVAATQARVLRCPAPALLDVLEDHPDLALAMATRFAKTLVDQGWTGRCN
jgi:hypothetical protein